MLLGLSCASSQGLWVATDDTATRLIAFRTWDDTDSPGLSAGMAASFDELQKNSVIRLDEVRGLFVVVGPGSFTGLRMSASFVEGLALGLGSQLGREIPVRSVPTFDLRGEGFWIPLRHQKARNLTLEGMKSATFEFLRIRSATEHETGTPTAGDPIWGLQDHPFWPNPEALLRGMRANLAAAPGLRLQYGLEPKITGQRG